MTDGAAVQDGKYREFQSAPQSPIGVTTSLTQMSNRLPVSVGSAEPHWCDWGFDVWYAEVWFQSAPQSPIGVTRPLFNQEMD